MKALPVSIYRDSDSSDCTNGGLSGRVTRALLIGEGLEGFIEPKPGDVVFRIVKRDLFDGPYYHVEPVADQCPTDMNGPMFGGNYVAASDSRLRKICQYPMPIHDRFETWGK